MKKKEYYSIPQLAKKLGLSRIAVYKQVKKGHIEAIRIGRSYAISKEYAQKFLLVKKGRALNEDEKQKIESVLRDVIDQYGDTLRKLGNE